MNNNNMADLFEDEHAKKKSREERKLEKIKKKEEKLSKTKDYKKLMDDEVVFKKINDNDKKKKKENKIDEKEEIKKPSVIDFLYDTLFGFVTILLFMTSLGYLGYTYYKNPGFNNFVVAGLLVSTGLFYMLSMFCKNKNLKRTFSILCSLSLMGFMAVELFLI